MAIWDILGKQTNKSLYELLEGLSCRVAVGVSVGLQSSPDALVKVVERYLAQGYGRIKIKIKPGRDIGDAQAVRRAFRTSVYRSMRTRLTRWKPPQSAPVG